MSTLRAYAMTNRIMMKRGGEHRAHFLAHFTLARQHHALSQENRAKVTGTRFCRAESSESKYRSLLSFSAFVSFFLLARILP